MPDTVQDLIRREAAAAGVPEELSLAVAEQESGFNPTRFGDPIDAQGTRAIGTYQLLPSTAAQFNQDPLDPRANIRMGNLYLRQLLDRHQGDVDKVLAEYGGVRTNTTYVPQVRARIPKFRPAGILVGGQRYPLGVDTANLPARGAPVAGAPPPQPPPPQPPHSPTLWERMTGTTSHVPADIQAEMDAAAARQAGTAPPLPYGDIIGERSRQVYQGMKHTYDPTTREGRRNLAGTGAAVAATPFLLPAGAGALTAMGVGALTAGGAGAIMETIEQINDRLQGHKKDLDQAATEIVSAGGQQAMYDVAGHAMLAPIRAVGRIAAGPGIMSDVAESFAKDRQVALEGIQTAVDAAKRKARQYFFTKAEEGATQRGVTGEAVRAARSAQDVAVEEAQARAAAALGTARETTRKAVGVGEEQALSDVATATSTGEQAQGRMRDAYGQTVGPPPSETAAGLSAAETLSGPAKAELNRLGEQVTEAARTGPAQDLAVVQSEARRMVTEEILPPERALPRATPRGKAGRPVLDPKLQVAITKAERKAIAKHPVMQVINRILNAKGPIKFSDLALFESQLGAAASFDSPVASRMEGARKHLWSLIRQQLGETHPPYDEAATAYATFRKRLAEGYGEQVGKLGDLEPARIVQMINPNDPTQTRVLMDTLAEHGPEAATAVREAWLHRNILQGGLESLRARLGTLTKAPEFARSLFGGDANYRTVFRGLDDIATAWENLVRGGASDVAEATALGRARTEAAKQLGAQRIESTRALGAEGVATARKAGERAVETVQAGGRQSAAARAADVRQARVAFQEEMQQLGIEKRARQAITEPEQIAIGRSQKAATEILNAYFGLTVPRTFRGAIGLVRMLTDPPRSAELLKVAAARPEVNRMIVDWLANPNTRITYQVAKRLLGTEVGEHVVEPGMEQLRETQAGKPPPTPGEVWLSIRPPAEPPPAPPGAR